MDSKPTVKHLNVSECSYHWLLELCKHEPIIRIPTVSSDRLPDDSYAKQIYATPIGQDRHPHTIALQIYILEAYLVDA